MRGILEHYMHASVPTRWQLGASTLSHGKHEASASYKKSCERWSSVKPSPQLRTVLIIHTTKEPEGHVDVAEAAEPTLTQESSIGDTPIPPTQLDVSNKCIKSTSVILSDEDEARVVEWLADHPLMFNKTIKEYKETDKKKKLWEELGEELGFTGRHKIEFLFIITFC